MPIGDFLRRRPEGQTCQACGSPLPHGAVFCASCGVKTDDPQAEPLHIVDRTTGLFNDRFVRPVLEDELARAHRYQRNLGVLLIEANGAGSPDEALKLIGIGEISSKEIGLRKRDIQRHNGRLNRCAVRGFISQYSRGN